MTSLSSRELEIDKLITGDNQGQKHQREFIFCNVSTKPLLKAYSHSANTITMGAVGYLVLSAFQDRLSESVVSFELCLVFLQIVRL